MGSVDTREGVREGRLPGACGDGGRHPLVGFLPVYPRQVEQEAGSPKKGRFRDFHRFLEPGGKTLNV